VVTNEGGPKYFIEPAVNSFVADTEEAFVQAVLTVMNDPDCTSAYAQSGSGRGIA
jgi:hypothetical protein